MRIVNVVELVGGVLSSIESFPISDQDDQISRPEQLVKAEELFMNKVGESVDNPADFLEDGHYDSDGYEVLITWSNVNV